MYPVCMIDDYSTWRRGFNEYWQHNSEKSMFWDKFEDRIVNSFNKYMLPVIIMKKENPKEAVCQVFEKVNTGGVSLNVFELLTATFAADELDVYKRQICDVLRYETKLEKEVFNNAIQRYIKDRRKNVRRLFEYAEVFNIRNKVQTYIGVWL